MEQETKTESLTPEALRDLGLLLVKQGISEDSHDMIKSGTSHLIHAYMQGDTEAAAWVGFQLYRGFLRSAAGDSKEAAIRILYDAALKKNLNARIYLNKFCTERYHALIGDHIDNRPVSGPLVDFEGKPIHIKKTGWRVPVDAVLDYHDGINELTFTFNLLFVDEGMSDNRGFRDAVIRGIKEWEGIYQVFGGQQLRIVIHVTEDDRLFDNVVVMALTDEHVSTLNKMGRIINTKSSRDNLHKLIGQKRSMTLSGFFKWSAKSKKVIYLISEDGAFKNYDEIKDVAKHEFGHILGLGDLYESPDDQLEGVEKGAFSELDGYYICNRNYNLVMSDHHGPISNNDIEMVVLAYSTDEMQLYQKHPQLKSEISKALGKGN